MSIELTGFLSSIRTTIDVVKGFQSTYSSIQIMEAKTELLERLIGIQSTALSLQQEHSALINEKNELQKKFIEFDSWKETESSYRLIDLDKGKFVYALKSPQLSSEPNHWLCQNCFNDRKKSILQAIFVNDFDEMYVCNRCKSYLSLH